MIISNQGKQPIFKGSAITRQQIQDSLRMQEAKNRTEIEARNDKEYETNRTETETKTKTKEPKLLTREEARKKIQTEMENPKNKQEQEQKEKFIYTRLNSMLKTNKQVEALKDYLNLSKNEKTYMSQHRKYFGFHLGKKKQILYNNLTFVSQDKKKEYLEADYEENGLGMGIDLFYEYIKSKYFGITRYDVSQFLSNNAEYVLAQPRKHRTNKPIAALKDKDTNKEEPATLFAIDLIDMEQFIKDGRVKSKTPPYLFVCIDIFSRYVFIEPMFAKDEDTSIKVFKKIMLRTKLFEQGTITNPNEGEKVPNVPADRRITTIMSDRGGEFFSDKFQNFCRQNFISQRFTRSQSPQANGVVERVNKEIRKILNQLFVREGEIVNWNERFADGGMNILEQVERAKNSAYHPVIKDTPENVWNARSDDSNDKLKIIDDARKNSAETNSKKLDKYKNVSVFKKGDRVLLEMSVYYSNIREMIKAKNTKSIVLWYMPKIWIIKRVVPSRNPVLARETYILKPENEPRKTLMTNTALKRTDFQNQVAYIYGSKLVPVPDDLELLYFGRTDAARLKKALKMNGAKTSQTDLIVK